MFWVIAVCVFILIIAGSFLYGGGFDAFMLNNFGIHPKGTEQWLTGMCTSYATEGAMWTCVWSVIALLTGIFFLALIFGKAEPEANMVEHRVIGGRLILVVTSFCVCLFSVYMIVDPIIKCGGVL